ncbi:MAG TPA: MBL fold metallo-hydrolase [Steroidobacteraceae bacterium]|nr:MBL fold metallo-hydrolase [Steroidobacteraceae bacterium]
MKRSANGWARRLVIVLAGLLSATAQGRPPENIELPDWSKTPVEDRDLGHGVHMLESFGGNIGVLAGDEGVLLVDAEWPELHDKVVTAVARISPKPIRYIVNTHWHWDHVGGDSLFAKAGAVLISSEETRAHILAAQGSHEYRPDPAAIPVITTKAMKLHLAGQTVEIIHAPPAHTDGDLVVRYVEADVIQTGDTFFHGFYPDIDQPHGGSIDGMIAWYDTLYKMCGPNTKIIPGHGPVAHREDVREYQAMLREVRNRVAKAVDAGMTEEALIASHPLDDLDVKWGGNLIKQPYLLAIVYEELQDRRNELRRTP